jgi:hypothetical protein
MVYAYDPASGAWTKSLDIPLDYKKGEASLYRHGGRDSYWQTWTDEYINDTNSGSGVSAGATIF